MMTQKSNKKLDAKIIQVLTQACEKAKNQVEGFVWLTHQVDYRQFPSSLKITCVFDTRTDQEKAVQSDAFEYLQMLIIEHLQRIDVTLKANKHVFVDNEQDCTTQHSGDWQQRLAAQ